jgi:hypothetical protein
MYSVFSSGYGGAVVSSTGLSKSATKRLNIKIAYKYKAGKATYGGHLLMEYGVQRKGSRGSPEKISR